MVGNGGGGSSENAIAINHSSGFPFEKGSLSIIETQWVVMVNISISLRAAGYGCQ